MTSTHKLALDATHDVQYPYAMSTKEVFDVDMLLDTLGGAKEVYAMARELNLSFNRDTVYHWRRGVKLSHDRMVELELMAQHADVRIDWRRVLLNGGAR